MNTQENEIDRLSLSYEEKKKQLFLKQKELLDTFLEHHAISQAQYDKSLGDLIYKMGIDEKTILRKEKGLDR